MNFKKIENEINYNCYNLYHIIIDWALGLDLSIMFKMIKQKLNRKRHTKELARVDNTFNDVLPTNFFKQLVKLFFICMISFTTIEFIYTIKYTFSINTTDTCISVIASNFFTCFCNFGLPFIMMLRIFEDPNSSFHVKDEVSAMISCGIIALYELIIFIIPVCLYVVINHDCYNHVQANTPELWNFIALQSVSFLLLIGMGLGALITCITVTHFTTE